MDWRSRWSPPAEAAGEEASSRGVQGLPHGDEAIARAPELGYSPGFTWPHRPAPFALLLTTGVLKCGLLFLRGDQARHFMAENTPCPCSQNTAATGSSEGRVVESPQTQARAVFIICINLRQGFIVVVLTKVQSKNEDLLPSPTPTSSLPPTLLPLGVFCIVYGLSLLFRKQWWCQSPLHAASSNLEGSQ